MPLVRIFQSLLFFFLIFASQEARAFPTRIITLSPALAENVAQLLENDLNRIVGVSEFSDFPNSLKRLPTVGSYQHLNLEKIASLRPDLIIAGEGDQSPDEIQKLRNLHFNVLMVQLNSLKAIAESFTTMGVALGDRAAVGKKLTSQFKTELSAVQSRVIIWHRKMKIVPPRVFLQLSDHPLITTGSTGFLRELFELLGTQPLYQNEQQPYPHVSLESLISQDPEWIFIFALSDQMGLFEASKKKWIDRKSMRAAREKKITILNGDWFVRPTFRLHKGLQQIEKMLYEKHP